MYCAVKSFRSLDWPEKLSAAISRVVKWHGQKTEAGRTKIML